MLVALSAALLLVPVHVSWASNFYVNPIKLLLSGTSSNGALTIKNNSTEPLRFQLSVSTWTQDPTGQMLLAPTRDLVFFPRLLVLAPGAQRVIRVGLATSVGPVEKSYRVFVEELPPVETEQASPTDGGVRVRVRVGIPVFVQPARARAEPRLAGLGARERRVVFELQNPGTVHVPPHRVRATGYGDDGIVVWERELGGWYVLAKSMRRYEIEIGPEDCSKTKAIVVDVGISPDALTERLADVQQACAG